MSNNNLPATTDENQISHVGYLDDRFIEDYKDDVSQFNKVSKDFAALTLRIGLRLEFIKSKLKHGQLNRWIDEHGGISTSHAHRCRKLAQIFIETQKIKAGEVFALVDPEHSADELSKKLEQMAFDFLGEKTQAELFAEYGIAVREQKKLGGDHGGGKARAELTPEEIEANTLMQIRRNWQEMGSWLSDNGLESMTWAELDRSEILGLQALCESLATKMSNLLNKRG